MKPTAAAAALLVAACALAGGGYAAPISARVQSTARLATAPTADPLFGRIVVEKNVMVPMRDGVRLATDVYRPAGTEKHPVVLIRTPYGSEKPQFGTQARFYVSRGYAFAVQDCRGKYDSEGDWYSKRSEAQDGSDTITWLGTRPWSSGKVGMTGGSYRGMVQYLVADQENPYLGALVPLVAPTTLGRDLSDYDHLAVYSGRESTSALIWMLRTDGRVDQNDENFSLTLEQAWDHLPLTDYPRLLGRPMKWWPFILNQRYGFWEEYYLRAATGEWSKPLPNAQSWWRNYEERYRKVNVPMLHMSGWFDCCGEQPIKMWQMVRQLARDPVARDNQQLVLGPWPHVVGQSRNGQLDFGPAARMDPDEAAAEWFDHWLKGIDNGVQRRPPVRAFVMGENRWREASEWPIPKTQFTRYYLRSRGEARIAHGGAQLSTEAPTNEPVDRYTYDPADARPLPGETLLGTVDIAASQRRDDVLVYMSEVLEAPIEVTGPLSAVLYVATSAPSTDFFVRLVDVHPDGKAYLAINTYANPFRTHWSKNVERAADGTRIVKAEIVLPPTSILFQSGHRMQVEISSAAMMDASHVGLAKRFGMHGLNVEPGTEATATRWNVAHQSIYHDAAHPSHIVLPVIPR